MQINGEPGIAWLDNMRNYGRMDGVEDRRDHRAMGGNPYVVFRIVFVWSLMIDSFV